MSEELIVKFIEQMIEDIDDIRSTLLILLQHHMIIIEENKFGSLEEKED